jgi:hypothetical protein
MAIGKKKKRYSRKKEKEQYNGPVKIDHLIWLNAFFHLENRKLCLKEKKLNKVISRSY